MDRSILECTLTKSVDGVNGTMTSKKVFYFRLSQFLCDDRGGLILGLSMDWNLSDHTKHQSILQARSTGTEARRIISVGSSEPTSVVALKLDTQALQALPRSTTTSGGKIASTPLWVVLTVEKITHPSFPKIDLELILTQAGQFKIVPQTDKVSLVVLTPHLARKAGGEYDQCRALLADRERCPLAKNTVGHGWCLFHWEQKVFLHDEALQQSKDEQWVEAVQRRLLHWGNSNQENITFFNRFQIILALRILITEVLYAGDWDDNHGDFLVTVKHQRAEVCQMLATKNSDGSGRVPVNQYIDKYLALADKRGCNPQCKNAVHVVQSQEEQVIVDLREVSQNLATLPHPSRDHTSTGVSQLFSNPEKGNEMRQHLTYVVESVAGDLPALPTEQTQEERDAIAAALGWDNNKEIDTSDW